jgi:signal transduction histidine kinase
LRLNRAGDATDFTETEVEQLQQLAKAIGTIYVSVEAMDCLGAILDRVHEPVVSTVREASGKEAAPSAWRIEYANSAALAAFSYSSDEFIGQDARELYGPPAAHAVRKRLKIRSSVRRLPTTFAHKTQGRIPVLLSATVGESVLFGQRRTLGHIVDVEQTMSEQLARAREMATVFAHEIGVPILGIVADVESLIAELPEGLADMLELAEHIRVQMDVLLGKSGDLVVQFAPSRDLKRKTEYVDSIVEDVLALYRALARRKGVIIEALRVSGRVRASVHAAQYKQIIRNLVHNAVKYSYFGTASRDRTIRSTVYYADEHAVFEISNYGVGIRPHEIELIWHAGYRGELAKAEDRVGSGIGLASVKRIVDLHNGHVRCESRPLVDPTGPWLTKFIVSVPRGSGGK